MKSSALVLALIVAIAPCSEALSDTKPKSFWEKLFATTKVKKNYHPPKSRVVHRKKEATPEKTVPPITRPKDETPRTSNGYFIVDQQWYTNYLAQEMLWDYWIPEDADVKYKDGKYYVPPVVYKHFGDMASSPKRKPVAADIEL